MAACECQGKEVGLMRPTCCEQVFSEWQRGGFVGCFQGSTSMWGEGVQGWAGLEPAPGDRQNTHGLTLGHMGWKATG